MNNKVPVVTIDGPSGSGKGTIAQRVALAMKWHYLDSGALYRVVAWAALNEGIEPENETGLSRLISGLGIEMPVSDTDGSVRIFCGGTEITDAIRTEPCSVMASKLSAIPLVREGLWQAQQDLRKSPGLVTDGRDMGTVVFPDALAKFYFVADPSERAKRRHIQLKEKGIDASLPDILEELEARDQRDQSRDIAPSKPADDAVMVDTTSLTIDEVFATVMDRIKHRIE